MIINAQSTKLHNSRDAYLDAVKGFLILCVVLEHNTLLTGLYEWIRPFCDAFAAGCFLILTFARPLKCGGYKAIMNKLFSYWWPFFIFVSLTAIINYLLFSSTSLTKSFIDYVNAIFFASPQSIKISSGFMYLWFLPCLCVLTFLRFSLVKLGLITYLIAMIAWAFVGTLDDEKLMKTPFSLHVIAFVFIIGLVYAKLHNFLIAPKGSIKCITVTAFIICSIFSVCIGWELFLAGGIIPSINQPALILFYSFFMLIAIPGIYNIFSFFPRCAIRPFVLIGKHSVKVYLFHPLVYFSITQLWPCVQGPVFSLVITLFICLVISTLLEKFTLINDLVFPRSFSRLMLNGKY